MDNIYTYVIDLPSSINEMVTPCFDGYTVYINACLSPSGMRKAYNHAIHHITNHDFEKSDVQQIEMEAHGAISQQLWLGD